MTTKQKILNSARELFNEKGISATSMRDIAENIKISPGNLTYHFRYKEKIVEAIYYELIQAIDTGLATIDRSTNELSMFYQSTETMMYIVFDYRCIFRELYKILDNNSELKKHYIQLKEFRHQQFLVIIQQMVDLKIIRAEKIENEYERLSRRMYLLSDNWINALELQDFSYPKGIIYYTDLIFDILFPYMTKKGEKQYLALVNKPITDKTK